MNNISAEVSVKFPGILQFPRDGGKNNYQLYYYNSFLTNFKGRGVFVCLFWSFCFGLNFLAFFWCVCISLLVADCFRTQRESNYFVLDELLGNFFILKENNDQDRLLH